MDYEVHIYGKDGRLSHVRALRAMTEAEARAQMADLPYRYDMELRQGGELIFRIERSRPA